MLFNLWITIAAASSVYPATVAELVGSTCEPTCTVCHETAVGGGGTVVQDLGVALMARGLTGGGDTVALEAALTALEDDGVDSDGDGTLDVDELASGSDPNPGGEAYCEVLTPTYGCLSHTGRAPLLGLALFSLLALRRTRPHRG
ncbi:MAG TPA: hypothetical protein ENK18_20400 [Deltaproteobacteria bacterium]|nr:hypothetical protein [Deltaproteobacteria bacterium]